MRSKILNRAPFVVGAAVLAALFALPSFVSPTVSTNILLLVIFAIGFNLLLGFGGQISLGHGGLLGVGSYATALFVVHVDPSVPIAVLAGVIITTVAGAIFGKFSLYTRGIAFAMITLALGQILFALVFTLDFLGGGAGLYLPVNIETTIFGIDLVNPIQLFTIVYVLLILSVIFSYRLSQSPYGKILLAIKDNEERAKYLGYNTQRHLLVAFTISAAFAGLAGALQAVLFLGASQSSLQVQQSLEVLLATIIGGTGTTGGPIIGMLLFQLTKEYLTSLTDNWALIFGVLFIITTYFLKGGIYGKFLEFLKYLQSEN